MKKCKWLHFHNWEVVETITEQQLLENLRCSFDKDASRAQPKIYSKPCGERLCKKVCLRCGKEHDDITPRCDLFLRRILAERDRDALELLNKSS